LRFSVRYPPVTRPDRFRGLPPAKRKAPCRSTAPFYPPTCKWSALTSSRQSEFRAGRCLPSHALSYRSGRPSPCGLQSP